MKRLIIFEGPDGAGKTTLANAVAKSLGAIVTHHGPYPGMRSRGIMNAYATSIHPAVLGHDDAILDRCWISEKPYGIAFRNGEDRVGDVNFRAIEGWIYEHRPIRCRPLVVLCMPTWSIVAANFYPRKADEYLEKVDQLKIVYDWYFQAQVNRTMTTLPVIAVDPFSEPDLVERICHA